MESDLAIHRGQIVTASRNSMKVEHSSPMPTERPSYATDKSDNDWSG